MKNPYEEAEEINDIITIKMHELQDEQHRGVEYLDPKMLSYLRTIKSHIEMWEWTVKARIKKSSKRVGNL